MEKYAELEIRLHRRAEGEYAAALLYSQPDNAVVWMGEQGRVQLDPTQLRVQKHDPEAYARSLTDCFFLDPEIKKQFAQVRSSAETLDLPLRVRLLIDPNARELHTIFWELLLDPDDGTPLFTGEKIIFSRYLSSQDMRPVKLPQKTALRALVFIANPTSTSKSQTLNPIDADGEFERARQGLGSIPATRFTEGPATLNNLVQALRAKKPHILYLVCHGGLLQGEPFVWLEDDAGQVALTHARELVTRFKELREPPLLVVLPACESGGFDTAGDARAAIGPRLAEVGIPAVVAMHGSVSMQTVAEFMPVFFRELQADGQVDRAMAVARGKVRTRYDFWMPVLFTRLKNGCIFKKGWPRVLIIALAAVAALLVLSAAFGAYQYAARLPWMGDGYNVIVATFTEVDPAGREVVTDKSRQISAWLYDDIEQEKEDLNKIHGFDLLGPGDIGPITGENREAAAQQLAAQTGASLIIFGRLVYDGKTYEVKPEFYISDETLSSYGGEVAGADRMGKAVPLGPTFDPASASNNPELRVRARVMRRIISGLGYLSTANYPEAVPEFQAAANDTGWPDEEGKEVAYLLLGAAQLLPYDPHTNPGVLADARVSFEKAQTLNPNYSRPYLGLAQIAYLSALDDTKDPQERARLLQEAESRYQMALERAEPGSRYALRARYGIGVVAMIRLEKALPGWTPQDEENAAQNFAMVLDAHAKDKKLGLDWYAAHTHGHLARLAWRNQDWEEMSSQSRQAIDMLRTLKGKEPSIWIARYWEYVGVAEFNRGNIEAAKDAYRQALDTGREAGASPEEIERWEDALNTLNSLKKGTT